MEHHLAYMLRYSRTYVPFCIHSRTMDRDLITQCLAYMLRHAAHVCNFSLYTMNNDNIKQRLAYIRCVTEHVCHFARAPKVP